MWGVDGKLIVHWSLLTTFRTLWTLNVRKIFENIRKIWNLFFAQIRRVMCRWKAYSALITNNHFSDTLVIECPKFFWECPKNLKFYFLLKLDVWGVDGKLIVHWSRLTIFQTLWTLNVQKKLRMSEKSEIYFLLKLGVWGVNGKLIVHWSRIITFRTL